MAASGRQGVNQSAAKKAEQRSHVNQVDHHLAHRSIRDAVRQSPVRHKNS